MFNVSFGKKFLMAVVFVLFLANRPAFAVLLSDPDDGRTWQGASVGTFAQLLFGSNTLANRQAVIDAQYLDDSTFNTSGIGTGVYYGNVVGANGTSAADGTYNYGINGAGQYASDGSFLDWNWVQDLGNGGTSWNQGNVWDLGGLANQAVVFPIVDHGPLPQEAIEYTVYLSNNKFATTVGSDGSVDWVLAQLDKVFLEGWDSAQIADGFTTIWRLPSQAEFRYVNVFAGGPSALLRDGDDEIDAVAGLHFDGSASNPTGASGDGSATPEPATLLMLGTGLAGLGLFRSRVKK